MKKSFCTVGFFIFCSFLFLFEIANGQTTSSKLARIDATGSRLYEYQASASATPRLLFPYSSTSTPSPLFTQTGFLFELLVDGTKTFNGFRVSRHTTDYAVELLNNNSYGIFQTGNALTNYFGSKTGIGGTSAFSAITPLHVVGNGLFTGYLGVGMTTIPTSELQIKGVDSVTVRFDPAANNPVVFANSATASCYQFWALRNIENPIEKGDVSGSYAKSLVFTINPTGEIVCKSAAIQNLITSAVIGATYSMGSPYIVADSIQLRQGAGEGKILISDRLGYGVWTNPPEETPQYWTLNSTTKTLYAGELKVGVGTNNTGDYAMAVNGTIGCKELKVEIGSAIWNWPDYVFKSGYTLPSLSEVEQFVIDNGHLPGVPSAAKVESDGIAVGEMQATLLKKVEELTLYLIDQQKLIEKQQIEINQLKDLIQNK
ncbi:MAG TPA: hypothetical protein DEO70_05710 [Bacteroidales bacterium]|nr:MAG: hypothetical protein A2X11_10865 [Bacteroidetes bacterium GWE2_42_24]OFY32048.1 MAG: hypothetical protein A2X09_10430 [Bacteroidetes bacterium GWF2_43_11]HBZ66316.1 hypothetical protein [Bacteroidales bacterium]